jgi:hypothetical protein
MRVYQWGLWSFALVLVLADYRLAWGQDLELAPLRGSGQGITGSFEGWFPNQDGSYSLLVGYYNRNQDEAVDIPIGPDNHIEPGGPDQGQPTHFQPHGRQWGLFTITVPKDFGDKELTWRITANGKTSVIPLGLYSLWRLEPLVDATGNTPPYIGFSDSGPFENGPRGQSESITANVATPLSLTVWVADDAKIAFPGQSLLSNCSNCTRTVKTEGVQAVVRVHWTSFRGPGAVKFDNSAPTVETVELKAPPPGTPFNGKATTTVTFSEPGTYILNVQADDSTGGGPAGRQCCWSNAKVKVSVVP